jgi:hypothetical protein
MTGRKSHSHSGEVSNETHHIVFSYSHFNVYTLGSRIREFRAVCSLLIPCLESQHPATNFGKVTLTETRTIYRQFKTAV